MADSCGILTGGMDTHSDRVTVSNYEMELGPSENGVTNWAQEEPKQPHASDNSNVPTPNVDTDGSEMKRQGSNDRAQSDEETIAQLMSEKDRTTQPDMTPHSSLNSIPFEISNERTESEKHPNTNNDSWRPYQKDIARRILNRTFNTETIPSSVSTNNENGDVDLENGSETQENYNTSPSYCCMARHHVLPVDASRLQRFHHAFMCPPHGRLVKILTLVLIGFMFWATLWSILGKQALPGGNFWGIAWVWIMSAIFGFLAESIRLPRLLGTLVGGLLSSNVPGIDFGRDVTKQWSFGLRKMAIVIVLIRAGLGVDLRALWQYKYVVARIGTIPMLVEGCIVAIATHYILEMPWNWAFLAGYTIAPMSAAAAIPFMIGFQNSGLGIDKGIPSIVELGAVLDNVAGLCVFSTFVGVVFTDGDMLLTVLRLFPLQIAIGLAGGAIVGYALWYIPRPDSKHKVLYRFIFLLGGCVVGAFATGLAQFSSAGPLANIVIAVVAVYRWKQQGWTRTRNPLIPIFSLIWIGTQLMLSGLVGALVDIRNTNWKTFGLGLGVLFIGMTCRLITQFIMAHNSNFNLKEKLFLTIAWLPKATIQAAIGSIALDQAIAKKMPKEDIEKGQAIFTVSVMAIGLWATLGALSIVHLGPVLLNRTQPKKAHPLKMADMKDACVQTGPTLWRPTENVSRQQSACSFYSNYARSEANDCDSEVSMSDPITIEMRHLAHSYL